MLFLLGVLAHKDKTLEPKFAFLTDNSYFYDKCRYSPLVPLALFLSTPFQHHHKLLFIYFAAQA